MNLKRISASVSDANSMNTQRAVHQVMGPGGKMAAIYVAAASVLGPLQVLAGILGLQSDESGDIIKDNNILIRALNRDSMLLAAVLVNAMCPEVDPTSARSETFEGEPAVGVGFQINFDPPTFWEAMQTVEKLTGRPLNRRNIDKRLIDDTRHVLDKANEPLMKVVASQPRPDTLH